MPAFRPTRFNVSHSGLGKRENYTAGRCSKSGILKFISLLAIHPLRERQSCLGCFSSMVILSRNQRRNRHKNKNVAKAQIKAQDISGGIEMVKLKTNEPIARKKEARLNSLQTLHYGSKGATQVHMQGPLARSQHAAGRDGIAAALQELVEASSHPARHSKAAVPLSAFPNYIF